MVLFMLTRTTTEMELTIAVRKNLSTGTKKLSPRTAKIYLTELKILNRGGIEKVFSLW